MLEHNDCSKTQFLKEILLQAINTTVVEMEDEELDAKHNVDNMITDNFNQPTITTNKQREKKDIANKR